MGVADAGRFAPTLALPHRGGGNALSWSFKLKPQMLPDCRPLALNDAEHYRISIAPVGRYLMIAQHAILLRAQPGDRGARRVVEPVRAELDGDAPELLERVRKQQQLALGVDRAALHAFCIPGVADFQPAIGRIDVEIARATDD